MIANALVLHKCEPPLLPSLVTGTLVAFSAWYSVSRYAILDVCLSYQ
jgi:hypothetical protein